MVEEFKTTSRQGDFMREESAQVWRYDKGRDLIFRVRRMVANELQVERKTEFPTMACAMAELLQHHQYLWGEARQEALEKAGTVIQKLNDDLQ